MEKLARLSGFIAAHAIWSVSDGATLITMLVGERLSGERTLARLLTERIEESIQQGRKRLLENPDQIQRAALAFDGYITLPDGKTDAVFIEAREYGGGDALPFEIAIPYRNAKSPGGFAVYRPKLMTKLDNAESLLKAFWSGVDSHDQAAEVWTKHIDQSR
jgi:hypothetical protein